MRLTQQVHYSTAYQCDVCQKTHTYVVDAENCEREHAYVQGLVDGQVVSWTEWQEGSDHGVPCKWPFARSGAVVRRDVIGSRVLLRNDDDEQRWVDARRIDDFATRERPAYSLGFGFSSSHVVVDISPFVPPEER